MEPKSVNPFDLTSKSQPHTRNAKDKRKPKKVPRYLFLILSESSQHS